MTKETKPFAYGNTEYVMTYRPQSDGGLWPSCNCGWTTEAAATVRMIEEAVTLHLKDRHPGRRWGFVRMMPAEVTA